MRIFATILLISFLASPIAALTAFSKIGSPADCPDNLKIEVKPSRHGSGLLHVSVRFKPREPDLYRGRVGATAGLIIGVPDKTMSRLHIRLERWKSEWSGGFDLHRDAFATSTLNVGSHLLEKDGMPTIGGGVAYEIALGGFLP